MSNEPKKNKLGWEYAPGYGPSDEQIRENERIEMQIAQEKVDRMKLDAQAGRKEYLWKLRSMKQRGRRY